MPHLQSFAAMATADPTIYPKPLKDEFEAQLGLYFVFDYYH